MPIPTHQNHRSDGIRDGQSGFTLLEIVVSLVLLGMLTAIAGMGLVVAVDNHEFSRTNVHIAQKAQLSMARMNRELMELTAIHAVSSDGENTYIIYDRMVEGETPPTVRFGLHHHSTDNTIRLYTELDTGTTTLDGSTINDGDVLIDNVNALDLSYFQGQSEWSFGADIQLLSTIRLDLSLDRTDDPGSTQDFTTSVHLRNTNNFGGATPTTIPVSQGDYSCFINALTEYGAQ